MAKLPVITIGRQFGSGGRAIARKLSERLGVPFYDKELLALAADKSGYSEEVLSHVDERATNKFFYTMTHSISAAAALSGTFDMSMNDKLFLLLSDVIKQKAEEGPCIIVGRCADYVLRGKKNVCNLFVHLDMEGRKARVSEFDGVSTEKAQKVIEKADKQRAAFYNYYTNRKWGHYRNYHLIIDSGIGIDKTVDFLEYYVKKFTSEEE